MLSEELAVIIELSPFPPLLVPASFIPTKVCLGRRKTNKTPTPQTVDQLEQVRKKEQGKQQKKGVELFGKMILNRI